MKHTKDKTYRENNRKKTGMVRIYTFSYNSRKRHFLLTGGISFLNFFFFNKQMTGDFVNLHTSVSSLMILNKDETGT